MVLQYNIVNKKGGKILMEQDNLKETTINEKHLEFIQASITRMNQCSFQMKGWAITIVCALMAVYIATMVEHVGNYFYIGLSIAATVLFWVLDAYYLSREKRFIGIYEDVLKKKIKDFEMPLKEYKGWKYSIGKSFIASCSTIAFYLPIIIALVAFAVIPRCIK